MNIVISDTKDLNKDEVVALYRANGWSAAEKPQALFLGLINSDALFTARINGKLVGLGNAISDGHLVVYYPHLLVLPSYHGQGIGKMILQNLQEKYAHFHMQMLTADGEAVDFYRKNGFERAGHTQPMWIYQGKEH